MANKTNTLAALEAFVESQRALLARTQADIERLRALRAAAVDYDDPLEDLAEELADPAFSLRRQEGFAAEVQHEIDWGLFRGHDSSGLHALAEKLHATHAARLQPSTKQRSPLSPLQALVKNARRALLDPVFASYVPPSSDEEEELTPEQARKEAARAQIRALRQRRIGEGGLTVMAAGGAGVHVRRDVEDESAEVDVDLDGDDGAPPPIPLKPEPQLPVPAGPSRAASARTRKQAKPPLPKAKAQAKRAAPPAPVLEPEDVEVDDAPELGRPGKRKRSGKQSDTYKQAWSVSEQHLLERLLEEIPEGEKNRWAKISRAMQGKRTPRQVASRVQKYFEKLKRFGVDIGGSGGGGGPVDEEDPP